MKRAYLGLKYVVASTMFLANICQAGVKEGGGGILISAEFATAGREAIKILSYGDPALSLDSIIAEIKNTKIVPVDSICYTDPVLNKPYCEDAHYDSKNNIVLLSYQKWDQFSCTEKLVLSSHELMRAAGLETEDYTYSGRFLSDKLAPCMDAGGDSQTQAKCIDRESVSQYLVRELCDGLRMSLNARKGN